MMGAKWQEGAVKISHAEPEVDTRALRCFLHPAPAEFLNITARKTLRIYARTVIEMH